MDAFLFSFQNNLNLSHYCFSFFQDTSLKRFLIFFFSLRLHDYETLVFLLLEGDLGTVLIRTVQILFRVSSGDCYITMTFQQYHQF